MKNLVKIPCYFFLIIITFTFSCNSPVKHEVKIQSETIDRPDYVLVIHGGAGTLSRERMTPEREQEYREKLNEALEAGEEILKTGGTSLEAVKAAIIVMEDSPLFNAGKGAVFTNKKTVELDASVMDGKTLNAGAIAAVTDIKNPILAAFAVMEKSEHILLAGEGASIFAREQGLEIVDNTYFHTKARLDAVERQIAQEKQEKHGTVGAVALDKSGNLAAGTSTGGRSNKKYGRIGDSPIIGAGNYANNATCAVSGTGHGEYFMKYVVGHDISALMEYKGLSLNEAANLVINTKLAGAGGDGGIIAVDKDGNVAMPFNTSGMYRAYVKSSGEKEIAIFK
jgi:L-asparaginase / beta-aspartyl-peptidase